MAPAGAVGGGSYTSSDFGVQLLDVPKYYIVAAASSFSSNRYTANRVPLTPRRRDASCFLTLFVAVLTAGASALCGLKKVNYSGVGVVGVLQSP